MILHADLDAFFASVEQRDRPELRGRPVIVGGGVVLAASYEARAFGVRSAMGGHRARALCPHAVVVESRWEAYVKASQAVLEVLRDAAPVVEPVSIDEAFLDIRGMERLAGPPAEQADRLRWRVRERVGLPMSVGGASTKVLAKVAGALAKPDGALVLAREEELAVLGRLAVERVPGIGPSTAARLESAGMATVGEVAARSEDELVRLLGLARGRWLHAIARNRDPRRVRQGRRRRSFGAQSALGPARARTPGEVDAVAVALVDRVIRRMRRCGRSARTVVLRLRFGDYARASRSRTLPAPTAETRLVLATLRELLADAWPVVEARGLTLVGVALAGLDGGDDAQLALPVEGARARRLDAAVDAVRARFGTGALRRARLLGADASLAPWAE